MGDPATAGTVLGRACFDLDGDRRCGAGDPGIAGARLLLDTGQEAVADALGRYHLFQVPARIIEVGRSAHGAHTIALQGAPAGQGRVLFALPPGGMVQVDLAVTAPPPVEAPAWQSWHGGGEPPRIEGERLRYALAGRVEPGSRVRVDGRDVTVGPEGTFFVLVQLAPRENRYAIEVHAADGRTALGLQRVYWVRRRDGSHLIIPEPPEWGLLLRLPPAGTKVSGSPLAVAGRVTPGTEATVGGVRAIPDSRGRFLVEVPMPAGEVSLGYAAERGGWRGEGKRAVELSGVGGVLAGVGDAELFFLGKPRFLITGRAALAARGSWRGFSGIVGFDVDDRDRDGQAFLSPRDPLSHRRLLDPTRSWLQGGDDSAADDANAPRGRVYARVAGHGARLDLGSLRSGLTGGELGRYDRALYGAKLSVDRRVGSLRLEGAVFGAPGKVEGPLSLAPRPAHEELAATGGSLYWLGHRDVVVGSEALRVERRDPFTGLLVESRALVPGVDYALDPVSGRVLLAAPLASFGGSALLSAADPTRAPLSTLVVDYNYLGSDETGLATGGRASASIGPLTVAASGAGENRELSQYRLGSARALLDLGPPLALELSVARSKGQAYRTEGATPGSGDFAFSPNGGLDLLAPEPLAGEGRAGLAELRGTAWRLKYAGWLRARERGFSDGDHLELADAHERGGSLSVAAGDAPLQAGISWSQRRHGDRLELGVPGARAYQRTDGHAYRRFGSFGGGIQVFDQALEVAGGGEGHQLAAGALGRYHLNPRWAVVAGHVQAVKNESVLPDETFSSAGVEWSGDGGSLAARGGWGKALGPRVALSAERRGPGESTYGNVSFDPDGVPTLREQLSTIGTRRSTADGEVVVFSEEQFGRDLLGLRAGRAAGATVTPVAGLSFSARAERGARLTPNGEYRDRSAAGGSVSWVRGRLSLSGRGEAMGEGEGRAQDRGVLAGGAASFRFSERLTLAARGVWSHTLRRSLGEHVIASDAALSLAWRGESVSLLGQVAHVTEAPPRRGGIPFVRRDTELAHLNAGFQAASRLSFGLGAHLGLSRQAGGRDLLVSGSARAVLRVAGPVDTAVEYATRARLEGQSPDSLHSTRAEIGLGVEQGRVAVGYNLFGFSGTGVDPAEADAGRLFLKMELAL
jgi:hypothetical protein